MKRARLIVIGLVGAILVGTAAAAGARRFRRSPASPSPVIARPGEVRAPDSVRIRVEVLNGTKVRGLARRATGLLRDRGFDVVSTGTKSAIGDTTLIIDLTGHPDWTARIARIMAPARVQTALDSSRYLDISVVLGGAWRPPADPLDP